jgi:SAM-dependent methyltransferase
MELLLVAVVVLIVAFGGVVWVGAPYLPTLAPQAKAALELLELKPGQTLLELGSGDGKVLVAAAQAGLQVVGVEINPFLVVFSWLRTRRYRGQVRVVWGNFWRTPWPPADGVFVFLLDRFMPKLDERMRVYKKPLVSFAFEVPGRKADAEKDGVFLYRY